MKKYTLIAIGLAIMILLLSGCDIPFMGEAEPTPVPLVEKWPTPVPVKAKVSPTPFPPPPALPVTPYPREVKEPTATPVQQAAQAEALAEIEVEAPSLNVRQGPGLAYGVVGVLKQGDRRPIAGRNRAGDWWQINYTEDEKGWVSAAYVAATGELEDVSQVAAPAPPPAPTPEAAEAAAPSLPGKLAFAPAPGGTIYTISADGTNLRQVADGLDPALSPDGTKIAYANWVDPRGIWVANADGSDKRHYYLSGSARGPAWSPDSKSIAFWQYKWGSLDPERKCWKYMEGGAPNIPGDAWTWGEGIKDYGDKMCWTDPPDPHYQLAVINLEDGTSRDLASDWYSFGPTWLPDGQTIAYKAERGLALIDSLDGQVGWLTDNYHDALPIWSPDGQSVAIQWWQHDHWEIFKLSADGAIRTRLTENPPFEDEPWNNVSPTWSPDSKYIAFVTDRRGRWEVWVMNADGSEQRPMFGDGLPGGIQINYGNVRERVISWSK
jgi:TolB protein